MVNNAIIFITVKFDSHVFSIATMFSEKRLAALLGRFRQLSFFLRSSYKIEDGICVCRKFNTIYWD